MKTVENCLFSGENLSLKMLLECFIIVGFRILEKLANSLPVWNTDNRDFFKTSNFWVWSTAHQVSKSADHCYIDDEIYKKMVFIPRESGL